MTVCGQLITLTFSFQMWNNVLVSFGNRDRGTFIYYFLLQELVWNKVPNSSLYKHANLCKFNQWVCSGRFTRNAYVFNFMQTNLHLVFCPLLGHPKNSIAIKHNFYKGLKSRISEITVTCAMLKSLFKEPLACFNSLPHKVFVWLARQVK